MYSVMDVMLNTVLWHCLLLASQVVDVRCCHVKTFTIRFVMNPVVQCVIDWIQCCQTFTVVSFN